MLKLRLSPETYAVLMAHANSKGCSLASLISSICDVKSAELQTNDPTMKRDLNEREDNQDSKRS